MANEIPTQEELVAHFSKRLAFETDASDVHADIEQNKKFVLVDVRGQSSWDQGHAVGAVHMHHSEIAQSAPIEIPIDMPVVVYCWGPGCNGAHKGALNFALLGYQVKEMIGGFEYWAREGYPVVNNDGAVIREKDPLTAPVNSTSCDCG
jgi:rhodanese-related sulfurtransferase